MCIPSYSSCSSIYFEFHSNLNLVFLGRCTIKGAKVVAMAATKKKLALHVKKAAATVRTPPSKRPCLEANMAGNAPHPKNRVKKLAKKEEREIRVISNQTIRVTTPSVSPPTPAVHVSTRVQ